MVDETKKMEPLLKICCCAEECLKDGCVHWVDSTCVIPDNDIEFSLDVMAPFFDVKWKNPRWPEFCKRLAEKVGCEVEEPPEGDDPTKIRCGGQLMDDDGVINEKSFAVQILQEMGMDVEDTACFLQDMAAFCHCQIIPNVEHNQLRDFGDHTITFRNGRIYERGWKCPNSGQLTARERAYHGAQTLDLYQ